MFSAEWLEDAVRAHVGSSGGSPALKGHWLTDLTHSRLGPGVYCWPQDPRVELYGAGLVFEDCGADGVRFDEIESLRLLDLRDFMLANKAPDSPVALGIETGMGRYSLVVQLHRYTALASILPKMVRHTSVWPDSGCGVSTQKR